MKFQPDLTQTSKGFRNSNKKAFRNSKSLQKFIINYQTFEEYLIDGYGLYSSDEEKLRCLNKPAFELLKKDKLKRKIQELGVKIK